eukprot:g574.t1
MFVHSSLKQIAEIAESVFDDSQLRQVATDLAKEIAEAIEKHGIVEDEKFGRIYAYEVDGCGGHYASDDANIPSLLSAPYLGFSENAKVYQNTRNFLLSDRNPNYHCNEERTICGISSGHTPGHKIWHMAVIMQGLTAQTGAEKQEVLKMLKLTTKDDAMHESFSPDSVTSYTRRWFGWPNSLFAEFIHAMADEGLLPLP